MQSFKTNEFLGLKTALNIPPGNSAKSLQNFVRHRHNGWLEQADGYGSKYSLPTSDTYTTSISIKDVKNVYIKEHGGKQVTVCVGTYSKKYRSSATLVPSVGVWCRPYWSGVAWVDAWRELTEKEYYDFASWGGTTTLKLDGNFGFASDYFKNWAVVFEDYSGGQQDDNYVLCESSAENIGDLTLDLTMFEDGTLHTLRSSPSTIILARNWINGETPSSLKSFIAALFEEVRITTGGSSSDINLMAGLRTKTFGWDTTDKSLDEIILDRGCMNIWSRAFGIDSLGSVSSPDPMPSGQYQVKATLQMDDNNETELRNPKQTVSDDLAVNASVSYSVSGDSVVSSVCADSSYFYYAVITSANKLVLTRVSKSNPAVASTVELTNDVQAPDIASAPLITIDSGVIYIAAGTIGNYCGLWKVNAATFTQIGAQKAIQDTFATVPRYRIWVVSGYLFISTENAGFDQRLYRVNISSLESDQNYTPSGLVTDVASYLSSYLLITIEGSPGKIEQIQIDGMSVTFSDTLTRNDPYALYVLSSTKVLIGYLGSPGIIGIYNFLGEIGTISVQDYPRQFASDGTYVYVMSGYSSSAVYVQKISIASLATVGAALQLSASSETSASIFYSSDYLYVAYYTAATPVSFISQISTLPFEGVILSSNQAIQFRPIVSGVAIGRRIQNMRVWISDDFGTTWYLAKTVSLLSDGILWDSAAYYDSTLKHFYHRGAYVTITGSDWSAKGGDFSAEAGRSYSDSGATNYTSLAVMGSKTFAMSPYIGTPSSEEKNKIVSCVTGGGVLQVDVFPNDVTTVVDVDYSDGDQIVGGIALADRLLVLKKNNIVLIQDDGNGGYYRDLMASGIGCCSINTADTFEDMVFFCGYSGIYSYSTSRTDLINRDWLLDWKALTDAQKESAFAIVDVIDRKYLVYCASSVYVYDIDSGEWTKYAWNDSMLKFAKCSADSTNPGTVDALGASNIFNLSKQTLHNGSNFTMIWESNEINPLVQSKGYAYDCLLRHIVFDYSSDVSISVSVYLDGSSTALTTYTLPSTAGSKRMVLAPLSARCKTFRVKYTAITTGTNQTVKIKSRIDYFDEQPSGGDSMVF